MKYHNQKIIKEVADKIKKEPKEHIKGIIKDLKEYQSMAVYEFEKINDYTAPEEIKRREQAVYYYDDLLEILGVK